MPSSPPAALGNGVWLISRSDDVPDPVCLPSSLFAHDLHSVVLYVLNRLA